MQRGRKKSKGETLAATIPRGAQGRRLLIEGLLVQVPGLAAEASVQSQVLDCDNNFSACRRRKAEM